MLCPAHASKAIEALGTDTERAPLFAVPAKAVTEAARASNSFSDLYCTVPEHVPVHESYFILEDVGTHIGAGRVHLNSINDEVL